MLKAESLSVRSDGLEILKGVDFSMERGEVVLVVGPNGSGKSTLFKAIVGMKTYTGRVEKDGAVLDGLKPHERYRLGVTLAPERMRVAEGLTVMENVEISGKFEDAIKIFPHLERIKSRRVEVVSGGERQMVVFVRAVLSEPDYLLLDEPFQGVSDENVERMLEVITRMKADAGIAIISHEKIDRILEIADRLYLMLSGKIRKEIPIDSPERAMKKLEKYMIV